MSAGVTVALAVLLLGAALFTWFRWIQAVSLEGRRWMPLGVVGVAVVLAVGALLQGTGLWLGIPAFLVAALGSGFLGLAALASQSTQAPAVAVGQPLPDFTAPDHNGEPFQLSSLAGQPVLIKFFRGHW